MRLFRKQLLCSLVGVAMLGVATGVQAEDLNKIFERITQYSNEKNYPKALEELKWAQNELNKLHTQKMATFFPESLAEFKGDKVKPSSALGMIELKRTYRKGSDKVNLSLMGGSAAGVNPFGQMARIGAMMGNQGGQETLRIQGRTSTLKDPGKGRAELTMFLDSGFMLKLESRQADGEVLKSMMEKLDIDALEKYLKG